MVRRTHKAPEATAAMASISRAWSAKRRRRTAAMPSAISASQTMPCARKPARAMATEWLYSATGSEVSAPSSTATAVT